MGIRINKDIGYFLAKKNIKKILVKNYNDILDDMYAVDEELLKKMLAEFDILAKDNEQLGFTYARIQLKNLLKDKQKTIIFNAGIDKAIVDLELAEQSNNALDFSETKENLLDMKKNEDVLVFNDFVTTIHDYDEFEGVMFKTPELAKASRFDDLIDYYEEVDDPTYKIKLLKQSMYPDNYYVCVKVPELTEGALEYFQHDNPRKPVLEVGDLITSDKLHYLMLYQGVKSQHDRVKTWAYPNKKAEKYFHPYINVITYVVAKASGLLKKDVNYVEFAQYLEPAIITNWG